MMGTERILAEMLTCAKRAGEAIMDIYGRPGAEEVTYKEDSSPLTAADKASDGVIKAALTALCPECGYLSEESEDDAARLVLCGGSSGRHQGVFET